MSKIFMLAGGPLLSIAALVGGSIFLSNLPQHHWAVVPVAVAGGVIGFIGCLIFSKGFMK